MPIQVHESRAGFNGRRALGWAIHILIGAVMLMSGFSKMFGFSGAARFEGLSLTGPDDRLFLIGAAEVITAALLLAPRLLPLGILVASAYWGGVVALHVAKGGPMVTAVIVLVMVWVGGLLRFHGYPGTLFFSRPRAEPRSEGAATA